MRMKKMMRPKKSTRAKKSSRFTGFTGTIGGRTIFLVVIGIMATAMLIAARQEIPSTSNASVHVPTNVPTNVPTTSQVLAKKPASARLPDAESAATSGVSADGSDAIVPAVDADAKAPKAAPVTITGCLEQNDETFRLKDAAGADVPKSRSWKSGFLKKGSASIQVVDAAHRVKLTDHVGERVSVTGRLVDREMQVRSLQRVGASCS